MATNNKEFLEQWSVESDPARREAMFNELTTRGLFPADIDFEKEYGLYPDIAEENFLVKLFHKKEFAENKLENLLDLATCGGKIEFELLPVQRFVTNYLSAKTPYNSALLYHGVGVGKTCSAISISEAFLYIYPKKKVYIIAPPNIQPNFVRTIFDIENVVIPNDDLPNSHNGCTGSLYLELTGTQYEKDRRIIERKVNQLIKTRYEFMGYIQLASYIERIVARVSPGIKDPERRRLEEIKFLRKEFSGTCMIIDEAHNLRDIPGEKAEDNLDVPGGDAELTDAAQGKRLTSSLKRVLQYAMDMKLVLLTATPMYNSYLEIIFLLNLLLENDKMATLKPQDVFDLNGSFKEGGERKFGKVVQCYISYMRGETPVSFPIRLSPSHIPTLKSWPSLSPDNSASNVDEIIKERLLRLPIIPVRYGEETYSVFEEIFNSSIEKNKLNLNSIDTMVQSGNWIYPNDSSDLSERIRDRGFDNCFSDDGKGRNPLFTKSLIQYRSVVDVRWLVAENLINYSPKASFILKRIRKSEGPIFIYSRFIKSGGLPLALALEANGYTMYGRDRGLLADGVQVEGGLQCALCEHRKNNHSSANHTFVPAKYVLLTGNKDISPNNNASVNSERSYSNYNGADIKVVIGSQIASEGIDFKFIREIYVFDSWFHLNKMEQVLGRGIRTCSHIHEKIIPEKRNTTVYLMVNTLENRESADMYMYRKGMIKAIEIGKVSRAIKRYAIDCNLNIEGNLITSLGKQIQINSQNAPPEGIAVDINDKNYSNMCDWMECDYTCAEPIDLDLQANTLTYDEYSSRWRESQIKKVIKKLFETTPFIKIEDIQELMTAVPREALFSILHDIVGNKSSRLHVNGKDGYLIYKNGFYLFQPLSLEELDIPLALRVAHFPIKVDLYTPSKIEQVKVVEKKKDEGEENENENEKEKEKENHKASFITKFWEVFTQYAKKIEAGTLSSELPSSITEVIIEKYKGNKDLITYNIMRIEMVNWLYISIKNSADDRRLYAYVVLEYIWDNFLTSKEQFTLLSIAPKKVIEEQIVGDKSFRSVKLQSPYNIEYLSRANGQRLAPSEIEYLELNDTYNDLKTNVDTTGKGYGFMVPIKDVITFKSNKDVARVGDLPEGGQGCKIISTLAPHVEALINLGRIIRESQPTDYDLNKEKFAIRKFSNVQRYCALRELVLRFMDVKKMKGLRWFYRPISSYKTKHGDVFLTKGKAKGKA